MSFSKVLLSFCILLISLPLLAKAPPELDPNKGQEIGLVFEAFLSPH
jgi:hypothetical protein